MHIYIYIWIFIPILVFYPRFQCYHDHPVQAYLSLEFSIKHFYFLSFFMIILFGNLQGFERVCEDQTIWMMKILYLEKR